MFQKHIDGSPADDRIITTADPFMSECLLRFLHFAKVVWAKDEPSPGSSPKQSKVRYGRAAINYVFATFRKKEKGGEPVVGGD